MNLKRKVYETRAEKQKDFAIGVGVFFGLNAALSVLAWAAGLLLMVPAETSTSDLAYALALLAGCLFYILPFLVNIVVLIYFMLTRTWIAIGMLGTFGILLILGLIVGVIASIVCFATIGAGP